MTGPCQSAYFDSSNHLREVDYVGYASPGPGLAELAFLSPGLPGRKLSLAVKAELHPSQDVDWRIANARDPRPRRIESRINPAIYDGAR